MTNNPPQTHSQAAGELFSPNMDKETPKQFEASTEPEKHVHQFSVAVEWETTTNNFNEYMEKYLQKKTVKTLRCISCSEEVNRG